MNFCSPSKPSGLLVFLKIDVSFYIIVCEYWSRDKKRKPSIAAASITKKMVDSQATRYTNNVIETKNSINTRICTNRNLCFVQNSPVQINSAGCSVTISDDIKNRGMQRDFELSLRIGTCLFLGEEIFFCTIHIRLELFIRVSLSLKAFLEFHSFWCGWMLPICLDNGDVTSDSNWDVLIANLLAMLPTSIYGIWRGRGTGAGRKRCVHFFQMKMQAWRDSCSNHLQIGSIAIWFPQFW